MKSNDTNRENDQEIRVNGKSLKITNRDKVYFPSALANEITKGEIIDYYREVSTYILPYLRDRPESLNRHPNGISKPGFYQKDMVLHQFPEW